MLTKHPQLTTHCGLRRCFALLVALLISMPLTASPTRAATSVAASTGIDCAQTPFGRTLNVGAKNQIFISTKDASPGSTGALNPYHLKQDPASGIYQEQGGVDFATEPTFISALASTTADLDGDGKAEYIQGFTDANLRYKLTVNKNGSDPQSRFEGLGPVESTMAAGDMLGVGDGSQQVVVAARARDGSLTIDIYQGILSDGGIGSKAASWSATSLGRSQASAIHVAVGNLNNNKYADIVVSLLESNQYTEQVIVLEYQPNVSSDTNADAAFNLKERATREVVLDNRTSLTHTGMALASLDGSPQDSVILSFYDTFHTYMYVYDLRVTIVNGTIQFAAHDLIWTSRDVTGEVHTFAMATGDVMGQHRDQIIVGYDNSNAAEPGTLNIRVISLVSAKPFPQLQVSFQWQDDSIERTQINYLSLAVGDLNKDNRADVVAAFKDASPFGFDTLILAQHFDANNTVAGLLVIDSSRHDTTIAAPPSLALGDWDNESLHAVVQGTCAHVEEHIVTSVGFVPPYWANIQDTSDKGGSIGRSVSSETGTERSLTYHRSDTVSAYVGGGLDVDIPDIFSLSAVAKATGAREYAMNNTSSTGVTTSTTTTVGHSWTDDALLYEPAGYDCYSYQLQQNDSVIPPDKAKLRFCNYQAPPADVSIASELNSWDAIDRTTPYYSPIVRDWSNLALFRGAFTHQSSTASNTSAAALAVDSQIVNGTFVTGQAAQTASENHPWWQVDLGTSQPLSTIRLWTPTGSLQNVHVFVSDTDFTTIPGGDDPNTLLAQPGVQHYTLVDLGDGFAASDTAPSEATWNLSLDAPQNHVKGRYIRVQRGDTGILTLSEVQVFGPNHVDPDRYPLDMRNLHPGSGSFEVLLYNPYHTSSGDTYVWVLVRGSLLWDGRFTDGLPSQDGSQQGNLLNGLAVAPGNGTVEWSITNGKSKSRVAANEIDNTTSAGIAFEAEAASSGIKVVGGYGQEHSSGLATENTASTTWSNEFDMGGRMTGFPREFNAPIWLTCRYRFQPYYYATSDTSNLGYRQSFPVLDYLVPQANGNTDLYRTGDLSACRNGNQTGTTAQASNDNAQTLPGQSLTLNVLANDSGNNLTITDVGAAQHGTLTHTARTITYTPNAGFVGTDSFNYTISDGDDDVQVAALQATNTGSVTVNVGSFVYLPSVWQ